MIKLKKITRFLETIFEMAGGKGEKAFKYS